MYIPKPSPKQKGQKWTTFTPPATTQRRRYRGRVLLRRSQFFEQDGGWYVQCKYGNKALALGKGNAVFVKALTDVEATLGALKAAAEAGELDAAMPAAVARRK